VIALISIIPVRAFAIGTASEYLTEMLMRLIDDPGRRCLRTTAPSNIVVPSTNTKILGR